MVTTKTIRLDVTKKYTEPIYLVQYEVDARILDIYLSAGSLPINLTGASVVFYAKKPDGTILFNDCTIVDAVSGHVMYTVTEQMCAVAGDLRCWILVIKDDAELRSIEFKVTVQPSEDDTEAIESTSEFTALEEALAIVNDYLPKSGGTITGPITTPNNAVGINIGDDARIANRNAANTMFLEGQQNTDRGYINFGQTSGNALGAVNGGNLTWRGNRVWDAAALPYETGTWTPTLYGSTTAGTPTYSERSGSYVRIGNVVHLTGHISLSSKGGMDGNVIIGGFPYQSNHQSAGILGQTYNTAAAYDSVFGLNMRANATYATVYKFSQETLKTTEVGNNLVIASFEITYTTG